MGIGHTSLRKSLKNETIYKDKTVFKHKHEFEIECILEVKNINMNNETKYFHVLKCKHCLSFKAIKNDLSLQGYIENINNFNLPKIKAITKQKWLIYDFDKLENVTFIE